VEPGSGNGAATNERRLRFQQTDPAKLPVLV
jgi:hypothetical protein